MGFAPTSRLLVHRAFARGFDPTIRWTWPVASHAVSSGGAMAKGDEVRKDWGCVICCHSLYFLVYPWNCGIAGHGKVLARDKTIRLSLPMPRSRSRQS